MSRSDSRHRNLCPLAIIAHLKMPLSAYSHLPSQIFFVTKDGKIHLSIESCYKYSICLFVIYFSADSKTVRLSCYLSGQQ